MLALLADLVPADSPLSFLRVFGYLTVRGGLALAAAFLFCVFLGGPLIRRLMNLQAIQPIRVSTGENARSLHEMHKGKGKVPTMGGLLMLAALSVACLLFCDLREPVVWIAFVATLGCAGIGFLDDYLKVVKKHHGGLPGKYKLVMQTIIGGFLAGTYLYAFPQIISYQPGGEAELLSGPAYVLMPFLKQAVVPLGLFYIPFAVLVLVGTTNAVNLTDGLDGLAAGVTISVTLCLGLVAYLVGRVDAAHYLIIPYVQGAGELAILLGALCGACFGFLWFNSHPAQVFMGDTGSMMLGGLLGSVALLIKQEILLLIIGGVFVAEALSVIIQVGSYKLRKKRVFQMAPLHHHYERLGVPESKIITRFWIVSALLSLAGLVTLKFR